ncbi:DUF4238 domain-containing protein [Pelagibacterium flavum]|uniref:DUF4238 domain-containing protein n=1 Tax=Pelagibacterium flavum TaxID=2984530 RepID=A0ABY6ISK0_9HYPH|nr:DUF4238 domain-containing protein [Pelagibacterium sp. YIM 151497]UYQ73553.1 DUF4238 domain-containing protein [Pelagibacterium sp. YIM 151497]
MEISAMRALIKLIDGKGVGEKMNALTWAVIDTTGAEHELLTSDRPIIRTNGLMAENGHLALPIGPRKLFLAAKDVETVDRISSIPTAELVTEANRQVVEFAVRFVYGTDDRQLRFVQNRMATKEQPRIVSGLNKRGREHLLKRAMN